VRAGQHFDGVGEDWPLVVFQLAAAQPLGVDAGFLGDQTLHKLFIGHFQREHGHVFFVLLRRVLGHREHKTGLAHTWAAGDNQQIRLLQPAQQLIQIVQPGGHTVNLFAAL